MKLENVPGEALGPAGEISVSALSREKLQFEVEQLLYAYVEYIDDDRLEELPDFFTEDCSYTIISQENVGRGLPAPLMGCYNRSMLVDRIVSLRHANIYSEHAYRHLLSNVRIKSVSDGEVQVQTNYSVMVTRNDGIAKVYSTGKYLDRIVVADGEFKFKGKRVVFDTHLIDTLLVRPI